MARRTAVAAERATLKQAGGAGLVVGDARSFPPLGPDLIGSPADAPSSSAPQGQQRGAQDGAVTVAAVRRRLRVSAALLAASASCVDVIGGLLPGLG